MPTTLKGWAIWAVAQAVLTAAFRLVYKLLENAVMGWGDDQIALALGLHAPSARTVFSWGLPFALAAGTLWLYHFIQQRYLPAQFPPEKGTTSDRRRIADYQTALKLPIIDDAISVLNHNAIFEQPIDDAGRFIDSIVPELKAGRRDELIVRLDKLRQRFVANSQRIGALYVQTESIHEDIATLLVQPYSNALMEGISELSGALSKLDNPATANVEYWIKPQLEKFKSRVGGVGAWRGTTLFALFDLRRKLIS